MSNYMNGGMPMVEGPLSAGQLDGNGPRVVESEKIPYIAVLDEINHLEAVLEQLDVLIVALRGDPLPEKPTKVVAEIPPFVGFYDTAQERLMVYREHMLGRIQMIRDIVRV